MKFSISLFIGQYIIFFNQLEFSCAIPMIGFNIRQAQSREYTFVVSIMRIEPGNLQSGGDHYCTGVAITRKDILTASHCLESESINEVQIVIGTIDLRNGQIYYVFWWQSYDQWAVLHDIEVTYTWNDIANLRLIGRLPENILPARLSRLSNTELYDADVIMAGWGINNDGIVPDIMQFANLKIVQNNICERRIERIVGVAVPMNLRILCTFVTPYTLIEQGDSGGPLLFRNRLVGINNGICPHSDLPIQERQVNLHIGVHYYRNFINYMKTA